MATTICCVISDTDCSVGLSTTLQPSLSIPTDLLTTQFTPMNGTSSSSSSPYKTNDLDQLLSRIYDWLKQPNTTPMIISFSSLYPPAPLLKALLSNPSFPNIKPLKAFPLSLLTIPQTTGVQVDLQSTETHAIALSDGMIVESSYKVAALGASSSSIEPSDEASVPALIVHAVLNTPVDYRTSAASCISLCSSSPSALLDDPKTVSRIEARCAELYKQQMRASMTFTVVPSQSTFTGLSLMASVNS